MNSPKPGYLATLYENGSYLGGVIVTDHRGVPTDFKYTDSVTPTKVQRIIYGAVLERYIRDHVIIGALIKEIVSPPSFYVVSQHELFEIEEANKLMLVSLQRTQLQAIGERGTVTRSKENECLLQGWMDPHPLRIVFGNVTLDQQERVLKDLVFLSKHMDLAEPLERLEKALKSLGLEAS